MLVCLAASVATLMVNLLLPLAGRAPDAFVTLDLMRLPLGILTGVGFIGGGAILRRGDVVSGVTTAATLWFVTVVGLCFGGGQIRLGAITTALGAVVLWGLDWAELRLRARFHARLTVTLGADGPSDAAVRRQLRDGALVIKSTSIEIDGQRRTHVYEVTETRTAAEPGVAAVSWRTAA